MTIQLSEGIHRIPLKVDKGWTGSGEIILQGNASSPQNVVLAPAAGSAVEITATMGAGLRLKDLELAPPNGNAIIHSGSGTVRVQNIRLGPTPNGFHLFANARTAIIKVAGKYGISGGGVAHWVANAGGSVVSKSRTVSFGSSIAFTWAFAVATRTSVVECDLMTFAGSATGARYAVDTNGAVFVGGAGLNYFPGNAAGTVSFGGQYV